MENKKTLEIWIEYGNETWNKQFTFEEGREEEIVELAQEEWLEIIGNQIPNFNHDLYDMGWVFVA
jgi:hypothetical protein